MSGGYDLDKPCLCPECDEPMQVVMPIWVTPGDEEIDTGEIDWESSNPKSSDKWYCQTCEGHWFPKEQEE